MSGGSRLPKLFPGWTSSSAADAQDSESQSLPGNPYPELQTPTLYRGQGQPPAGTTLSQEQWP